MFLVDRSTALSTHFPNFRVRHLANVSSIVLLRVIERRFAVVTNEGRRTGLAQGSQTSSVAFRWTVSNTKSSVTKRRMYRLVN